LNSDKRFLLRGSIINSLGLITRVASPLLVVLLARLYPQKEFGLFISLQALIYTLSRVVLLGLDKGLLWHVPKSIAAVNERSGLSDSFWTTFAFSVLVFAVCALLAVTGLTSHFEALRDMPPSFFLLMSASLIPFAAVQLFSSALEGARQPQYRVFVGLFLTTALVPALAIALKPWLGDGGSLGMGMLLGYSIGALLFLPGLLRHFPSEKWSKPARPNPALLHYSLPMAGSELVGSVLMRIDLWMVLFLLGPEKAAVYAVMVTLTNGLRTVRQTFDPLLIPVISGLKEEEWQSKLRPSFSYATNMVSTLQLFIACFVLVFPKEILSLAGDGYSVEIFAFAILLLGNLVNGFLGLNGTVLLGMGKSGLTFAIMAMALAMTLLLNWVLIPRFGMSGAALAATGGMLFQNIIHTLWVRFKSRLKLYEPHLYWNAALEITFIALFFAAYPRISALSLYDRSGLFVLLVLFLGVVVFLKRKTFSLK
jgi:O-antigen/teichoic acid export membrane protein